MLVTAPFLRRHEGWASCQDSQDLSLSLLGKNVTSSPKCFSGHWETGSAGCRGGSSPLPPAAAFLRQEGVWSLPACLDPGKGAAAGAPGAEMAQESRLARDGHSSKVTVECREHPLRHVSPGHAADAESLVQAGENHRSSIGDFNQRSPASRSPAAAGRFHHKSNQQVQGGQEPSAGSTGGLH